MRQVARDVKVNVVDEAFEDHAYAPSHIPCYELEVTFYDQKTGRTVTAATNISLTIKED